MHSDLHFTSATMTLSNQSILPSSLDNEEWNNFGGRGELIKQKDIHFILHTMKAG